MYQILLAALVLLTPVASVSAREANHLQGATSPYLLQHLYNPVDWYPWGAKALDKAKADGKLIFVSVGYSSCHWCHVMEDESFDNQAIAALLNDHFVSIKIDRESRPDLDEQFMAVTQILTGTGGWPNSVFLTPDGDPFHAGGYFPPDVFQSLVSRVQQAWAQNPAFVTGEAARVSQTVGAYLTRKAKARDVTPEVVARAVDTVLGQVDPFSGGYGVAPKFPREPLFLFLLDHAAQQGDVQALQAVTDLLDGMIKGGIHDHVGGGFHRYSVDPDWHIPHFEKMLYTQALTGRLLIRAWDMTGVPRYRRAAERLFDYTLRELRDPAGGFYSAQDADSLTAAGDRVEGAFYMWTPDDLAGLGDRASLVTRLFQITSMGDLDGANVLNMAATPWDIAVQKGESRQAFVARLDTLLADMLAMRNLRPPPFVDRKVVVSWNALMIASLAEAGYLLNRPDYTQAAEQAASFIINQMHTAKGLKRVWLDGSASISAQLPDYAALGLALIALHDFAPNRALANRWLAHAETLARTIQNRFGHAKDGYLMTNADDGLHPFIQIDDAEIPSGNALALTLFARLSQRQQAPLIEQDAYLLAAALSGHAVDTPAQRGSALGAIQELQSGVNGRIQFAGSGAVRAELVPSPGAVAIDLTIADGWHINGHQPLEDYFVATGLSVQGQAIDAARYPPPQVKSLGFYDAPLALYQGHLRLSTDIDRSQRQQIDLTLQACSDAICLQPETLRFVLWPTAQ